MQAVNPTTQRIQTLLKGHTDRKEEAEILSLLEEADSVTLNESLLQLELPELFSSVDDRWVGPDNKTRLLEIFSKDRLSELQVPARSAVVGGLQVGWTRVADGEERPLGGGVEERAITDIFLGSRGATLTGLKNGVNAGADSYDMHELLFHDIDDQSFRESMFQHIAEEGQRTPQSPLKPLSDIDDTFYSSLKDKRYPSDTVYPGVLAFYDELDRGAREDSPDRLGDLTFLTARPDEATGTVKNRTHATLRENGVKEAAILLGSLGGLISHEAMARKKMENFEQYTRIYPEYNFSWVGDSGQGDAILGERMLERFGDRVKGVFIHNVTALSEEKQTEFREKGIEIFDTYLGAAVAAFQKGLLSKPGLDRVAEATREDLRAITWDSEQQKETAHVVFARDFEAYKEL